MTTIDQHVVGWDLCPQCGKANDMASGLSDPKHKPEPGDISVCIACGEPSMWDEDMTLRKLTEEELTEISQDPEAVKMLFFFKKFVEEQKSDVQDTPPEFVE